MSDSFTIHGAQVLDETYDVERHMLSPGLANGQLDPQPRLGVAVCGAGKYLAGQLVINVRNCSNPAGATGDGQAVINPSQTVASDGDLCYLRDGDRALCSGILKGQGGGPCQCLLVLRARESGNGHAPPSVPAARPRGARKQAIEELAYAPFEELLLAYSADELQELLDESNRLRLRVEQIFWAERNRDWAAKEEARKEFEKELKSLDHGKLEDVTEVVLFRGRKRIYVRASRVKNHWRTHRVSKKDLGDAKVVKKLKWKSIAKKMAKPKIKGKLKPFWKKDLELLLEPTIHEFDLGGDTWKAGTEYAFLRLVAAGEVSAGMDLKERRLSLLAEGKVQFSLAEGKVAIGGWLPDREGWRAQFIYEGHDYDFGVFALELEGDGAAYAGASLSLGAKLKINEKADEDPNALKISAEGFAGARAGISAKLALHWHAPEDAKFELLSSVGFPVFVAAGAGAGAELKIEHDKGRFRFRLKAMAVLGLGGGATLTFEVDARNLLRFFNCLGTTLFRFGFHYISDEILEGFESLCALWAWAVVTGEEFGEVLISKYDDVIAWWENRKQPAIEAGAFAERVIANPGLFENAPPETKGRLLEMLTRQFVFAGEGRQEEAIVSLLQHSVRTRREFELMCRAMKDDGTRFSTADEGIDKLRSVLDWGERRAFDAWTRKLPLDPGRSIPKPPKFYRPELPQLV